MKRGALRKVVPLDEAECRPRDPRVDPESIAPQVTTQELAPEIAALELELARVLEELCDTKRQLTVAEEHLREAETRARKEHDTVTRLRAALHALARLDFDSTPPPDATPELPTLRPDALDVRELMKSVEHL